MATPKKASPKVEKAPESDVVEQPKKSFGEAPESDVVEQPKKSLPERIKLTAPYGFIDEEGVNRHWHQGAVVESPEEIELIVSRGGRWEE